MNVLAKEKKAETHAAVFGVVSGDEFVFGLRQIERNSFALRHRAYDKNEEGQGLKKDKGVSSLGLTISTMLKEPASITTGISESPSESS